MKSESKGIAIPLFLKADNNKLNIIHVLRLLI